MGLSTYAYLNCPGSSSDYMCTKPYLAGAVRLCATRSSATTKSVTVTCKIWLGFGTYANTSSHSYYKMHVRFWHGSTSYGSATNSDTVVISSGSWDCTSSSASRLTTSYTSLTQTAKPKHKSNTDDLSFTVSNWTSGSKTFYVQLVHDDSGASTTPRKSFTLACPDYTSSYTVTVASNNTSYGTVSGGGTYTSGSTATLKATPKAGYKFVKWTYSGGWTGGSTNATQAVTVTSAGTATATFEPYHVTVSFNVNGGSIPDNPHVYNTDYYWKVTSSLIYLSRDGTNYSKYTKALYPYTTDWDCYNASSFGLSKTGYHLKSNQEWNLNSSGSSTSFNQDSNNGYPWTTARLNGGSQITSDKAVTVYANWTNNTWTIAFAANGGSGSMSSQSHTYGTDKALPTCTFTPPTGKHFAHWQNAATGTTYPANYNMPGTWTSTNGNTYTFNAIWAGNGYQIEFNANGGSGSMSNQTGLVYGTAATLNSNAFTAPSGGYSFYGWATSLANAKAGTRAYTNGGSITTPSPAPANGGTVELYAIWKRTITFQSNWGSSPNTSTATQYYGGTVTPPAISALSSGWTAIGWRNDTTAGAKEYGANNTTAFSYTGTAQTLYAAYSRTLTITYAANGGSGTTPSNTTTTQYYSSSGHGTYPTVTLATNPYTKTGYSFTSWLVSTTNTNVNSGGQYTWDATSTHSTATTTTRTATAQWQTGVYTLTVDPNGGVWNGSDSVQTFTQAYNTKKSINIPQKPGCIFVGWTETGNGSLSKHVKGDPIESDTDPCFDSSTSGVLVYNNSQSSANGYHVTHTRQSSSAGYGSYEIKVTTDSSGTVSPGLGGFFHKTISAANLTYLHSFVAKLPVGYSFVNAHNSTGTDRFATWLTPTEGTGKWETYAYLHRCGTGGTFNTFGHVYIPTNTRPLTWYLACSNMIHATNGLNEVYTFGNGNGTIKALWAPMPMWAQIGGAWKRCNRVWIQVNGEWKPAVDIWGYLDTLTKGPNYNQNLFLGTTMEETPALASSQDWTKPFRTYNMPSGAFSASDQVATCTLSTTSNIGIAFARLATDISLDSNSWYTISCEAKSTQTTNPLCIGLSYFKTDNTWWWNGGANPQIIDQANTWQHFSVTFKPAADTQAICYCFTVKGTDGGTATFSIRHCKLEKGVIATPWTGAPYSEYTSTDPTTCSHAAAVSTTIEYCLDAGYNCGCGDYQHYKICPNCGSVYVDEPTLQNYMICDDCSETLDDWAPLINTWITPANLDTLLPDLKNATEYKNIYPR